jgi:dTDP-glucose 4,6-dehydratase
MGKAVRVLITGGRGFAGRHTIAHLLKTTDWDLISIEGRHGGRQQMDRLLKVSHDLRYPIGEPLDAQIGEIDAVIHLASIADVHSFLLKPANNFLNNVHSTLMLLEWARTRELKHFVLASTNEIYGPTFTAGGWPEWSAVTPSTPYSGSKAAQEAMAISWWRTFDIPLTIVNTMQLFGADQQENRLIPTAVRKLLRNETINIFGNHTSRGWRSASRNWTYVYNFADSLRWILPEPPSSWRDSEKPDRWNVAGPEFECRELVYMISHLLNADRTSINYIESDTGRPGHELRYALDTSKIHGAGWQEPYDFDIALEETVDKIARSYR